MLLALILSLTFQTAATTPTSCATTVIVVRHAEAESGDDPGLSEAGKARAKALARAVTADVAYASQFRRTKETAADLNVAVREVSVDRADIPGSSAALAKRVVAENPGKTVVVVGHSNTVPLIVKALSGTAVPDIAHTEYDRMYVVVVEGGRARVVAARY